MEFEKALLKNSTGMEVEIINYGGIVRSLKVPDHKGTLIDVVLGFDLPQEYTQEHPYFGAIIGRYANRMANGSFALGGQQHKLAVNDGPNSLHGGLRGFDKVFWRMKKEGNLVRLNYASADGEEGYPGNLHVSVEYHLDDEGALTIEYRAVTDKTTVLNLTNHSYFNLKGGENILDHVVAINAERFTAVNSELIPTGELPEVGGTPLDFRDPATVGSRINAVPGGYDHNYVLNGPFNEIKPAATVYCPSSGIALEVLTTEPGGQFYSGNFLDGTIIGKGGKAYEQHAGLCLETQHFPDSPSHPNFPTTVLRPDEVFHSKSIYRFSNFKSAQQIPTQARPFRLPEALSGDSGTGPLD